MGRPDFDRFVAASTEGLLRTAYLIAGDRSTPAAPLENAGNPDHIRRLHAIPVPQLEIAGNLRSRFEFRAHSRSRPGLALTTCRM